MNQNDIEKQKFFKLMGIIEELEEKLEILNKNDEKFKALYDKLIDARNELARVSDGCGHSHSH
jgi:hypothetical protein